VKIGVALSGIRTLFLDSAPIIYYVENVAPYRRVMDDIVARVTSGSHAFVTSSITLAECLIHPLRRGDTALGGALRVEALEDRLPGGAAGHAAQVSGFRGALLE
jgi:hypothetical protein